MSSNRIRLELVLLQLMLLVATLIPLLQARTVTDPDSNSDPDTTTTMDPYMEQQQQLELEKEQEQEQQQQQQQQQHHQHQPVPESNVQVDGQRIDCKLTFDAATMDSLGCRHNEEALSDGRALPGIGNKPEEKPVENLDWQRHLKSPDSQPIYELQLVVWPSDIEDGDDFSPPLATTTMRTTTTTTTSTTHKPTQIGTPIEQIWPLYEDQLVVFPQMDFEEENLDYFFDEVASPPTTTPTTGRPVTTNHPTGTPTPTPIYVVQNYHVVHPNGTEEYKLVMSNGLVNYKKLYTKRVGDQVINVQEGYNSVPIPGPRNQIQTQYYIADERGYNVYRIELHYHQPGLPKHLHYKATKATNM
ncbi:mediator of RNA polymerase II transcription subunit 13 [Drosophila eugracilis]|uniref:mediator of RNA polymerase II transcription subunit 13 n=1 Tax=Drosophila eugracilis TaxID=29029 RepID=UPI001BD9C692|nr:mediator of RNA polymerase II transcription subunit 13 [Drosophila eugracilis]